MGFFINVSNEILNVSYETSFAKSLVNIKFNVKPFLNMVQPYFMRFDFATRF